MKGAARAMTETGHRQEESFESNRLPGAVLVSITLVDRDPDQPRRDWRSDWQLDSRDASYKKTEEGYKRLDELTASIKEFGILQPLIVRRNPEKPDHFI